MLVLRVNVYEENKNQTNKIRLLEQKINKILLLPNVKNSCKVMKMKNRKIIPLIMG